MQLENQFTQLETFNRFFGTWDSQHSSLNWAATLDRQVEPLYSRVMDNRARVIRDIDGSNSIVSKMFEIGEPNLSWKPKPYPDNAQLYKQTVLEITGNALNRMGINAFNYVNKINSKDPAYPKITWMCCGEDANGAQFSSVCENIRNLSQLVAGTATVVFKGKTYRLDKPNQIPPFSFRPRGLHCIDASVLRFNDRTRGMEPIVGACVDLALWASFVLPEILQRKVLPLLYIPKMQVVEEAELWHAMLKAIESKFQLPEGTIKIVFLAETFPAVFCLPRLIEAFEGRCIGCNCGRWDYLFSYQSIMGEHLTANVDGGIARTCLPPKHLVTTNVNFLKKYQIRVAQICHQYGIQFIGGMNATLPSTHPNPGTRETENLKILQETVQNKQQEKIFYGASRTWVAHIGLLDVANHLARTAFDTPINKHVSSVSVSRFDLFNTPNDPYKVEDFLHDLRVVILYMTQYVLTRNGAIAIDGLMEDMATAEISCTLNWYQLKHRLLSREIEKSGGVFELLQGAGEQVLAEKVLPTIEMERKPFAKRVLRSVTHMLFRMITTPHVRPSLEKSLYILSLYADAEGPAFESLLRSKRFKGLAEYASIVQAIPPVAKL